MPHACGFNLSGGGDISKFLSDNKWDYKLLDHLNQDGNKWVINNIHIINTLTPYAGFRIDISSGGIYGDFLKLDKLSPISVGVFYNVKL